MRLMEASSLLALILYNTDSHPRIVIVIIVVAVKKKTTLLFLRKSFLSTQIFRTFCTAANILHAHYETRTPNNFRNAPFTFLRGREMKRL